jgi:uncharacterized protein (DUF1778 family)
MQDKNGPKAKEAKRARNAKDYLAAKPKQDHILLRLDKGGARLIDEASAAAGLSRAAFSRLYMLPIAAALGPKLQAIDEAARRRRQSLPQFLAAAIDASLAGAQPAIHSESDAASEFDDLFGTVGD